MASVRRLNAILAADDVPMKGILHVRRAVPSAVEPVRVGVRDHHPAVRDRDAGREEETRRLGIVLIRSERRRQQRRVDRSAACAKQASAEGGETFHSKRRTGAAVSGAVLFTRGTDGLGFRAAATLGQARSTCSLPKSKALGFSS